MSTDRELLELAAKAAGIDVEVSRGRIVLRQSLSAERRMGSAWNPLTDDGDALRLAVKLGLCVGKAVHAPQRFACPQETDDAFYEEENGNPAAAARRAIVRAAAAMGEQKCRT